MQPEHVATLALLLATGNAFVTINRLVRLARENGIALAALIEVPPLERVRRLPPCDDAVARALAGVTAADVTRARALLDRMRMRGIWLLPQDAPEYPAALSVCLGSAAPPLLFGQGDRHLLHGRLGAVVGTRTPTPAGTKAAVACAAWMARRRIGVVSGGARGVDSLAHAGALHHGGRTMAVLPQGLLSYVPSRIMAGGVSAHRVLWLSAFTPDMPWKTHAAIMRNAIISALVRFVCVVEPRQEGGSIRTARCALAQGKPVLVAPAPDAPDAYERLLVGGAHALLATGGAVDPAVMLAAWKQGPAKLPAQTDLFLAAASAE